MVENCYNTGNVTAKRRVGGLFGGAFTSFSFVRTATNSGKGYMSGDKCNFRQ